MDGRRIITVPNLSSWLCCVWGVVCVNPYSDLLDKNPELFRPMRDLMANELAWGLIFFIVGAIGLIFGYQGRRLVESRLMFATFTAFAVLYAIGDYSQPGVYWFGSIAVANLMIQGDIGGLRST